MLSANPTKPPSLHAHPHLPPLDPHLPLPNQYSILNQPHNPYQIVDTFALEIAHRIQKQATRSSHGPTDSLKLEMAQWEKKQHLKDKQRGQMLEKLKKELRQVQQMTKLKHCQTILEKIQKENRSNLSMFVQKVPMFMPLWMQGQGCACNCNCNRHSHCQNHSPPKRISRHQRHQSRQFPQQKILYNCAVGTDSLVQIAPPKQSKPILPPPSTTSLAPQPPKSHNPPITKPKTLLRRFRKVALAIYFCLYFKWFSFQFSINRYSAFKNVYLKAEDNPVTAAYREIYEKLLTMDILGMLADAGKQGNSAKPRGKPLELAGFLKKENQVKLGKLSSLSVLSTDKELLFSRCAYFILSLTSQTQKTLKQWPWGKIGQSLSIGTLTQSFTLDNTFLAQQIFLMVFHEEKGYTRLSPPTSRVLLMIKLFVKLLLFNVCLQLDNNQQWIDQHPAGSGQTELLIFLEIASKILFIVCQNLYEELLVNKQTNYSNLSPHFKIKPCAPLVYAHTIKQRRELFKNADVEDSDLLIYGLEGLDEINEIVREPFFQDAVQGIIEAVETCVDVVLEKIRSENRELYAQVKKETLEDEYLILRGIKRIMKNDKFYAYPTAQAVTLKDTQQPSKKSSSQHLTSSKNSQLSK